MRKIDPKDKKRKINAGAKKFIEKNKLEDNENVRIGTMNDNPEIGKIETIETGNIAFDILTGGGLIDGKINVFYGGPGTAKSTLVRDITEHTQKKYNAEHAYLNSEKTMDQVYWSQKVENLDKVIVGEFETTEQSLDFCMKCATGEIPVDILTIDTLQALSPKGEIDDKGKDKSVESNTIALIPRIFSQALRMFTSKNTGMTLLLVSQIRTGGMGGRVVMDDMTGGNAIKHYNLLTVGMTRSNSASSWCYTVDKLPPNSFTVTYTLKKIKKVGRYEKLKIKSYFVNGSFDRRFNIIAIGKDLGIFNGKTFDYPNPDDSSEMVTYTSRGMNETLNGGDTRRMPKEAVDYLETLLEPKFTELANADLTLIPTETVKEYEEYKEPEPIVLNLNSKSVKNVIKKTKKVTKKVKKK